MFKWLKKKPSPSPEVVEGFEVVEDAPFYKDAKDYVEKVGVKRFKRTSEELAAGLTPDEAARVRKPEQTKNPRNKTNPNDKDLEKYKNSEDTFCLSSIRYTLDTYEDKTQSVFKKAAGRDLPQQICISLGNDVENIINKEFPHVSCKSIPRGEVGKQSGKTNQVFLEEKERPVDIDLLFDISENSNRTKILYLEQKCNTNLDSEKVKKTKAKVDLVTKGLQNRFPGSEIISGVLWPWHEDWGFGKKRANKQIGTVFDFKEFLEMVCSPDIAETHFKSWEDYWTVTFKEDVRSYLK